MSSYPQQDSTTTIKRRKRVNILPGAWIEEVEEEDNEEFVKTVSPLPPQISLLLDSTENDHLELLKQTIANLRKEKEKLEETNDIVKKSIQIVARKRIIAHQQKRMGHSDNESEAEEEDIYIIVPSDFITPTCEEMKAAGLDGWEWVSAY